MIEYQLPLPIPDLDEGSASQPRRTRRPRRLRRQLGEFERRLVSAGRAPNAARTTRETLSGILRDARCRSLDQLDWEPQVLARLIQEPVQNGRRRARLLAFEDLIEVWPEIVPGDAAQRLEDALSTFGGRTVTYDHLADTDLGGSRKDVRRAVPFGWVEGGRLIEAAANGEFPQTNLRDAAKVVLHVRTTLRPKEIDSLNWQDLLEWMEGDEAPEDAPITLTRLADNPERVYAVHEEARFD